MRNKKYATRLTAVSLIVCLLFSLIPESWNGTAKAAAEDLEVMFSTGAHVGNLSYKADNAFMNFYNNQVPGFVQTQTASNSTIDWAGGDVFAGTGGWDSPATVSFQIRVADNPILREMALGGEAEMVAGFAVLRRHSKFLKDTIHSWIRMELDGQEIMYYKTGDSQVYNKSVTAKFTPNSVLTFSIHGDGADSGEGAGIRGFYLKFQDMQRPVIDSYTFTGNGNQRDNTTLGQKELYVKENENITLAYNFSEPVRPHYLNASNSEFFLKHPLFTNPEGSGLPAAGQTQYMQNITYGTSNLESYQSNLAFQYTGVRYHNSGNLPLEPRITGTTPGNTPMEQTLQEKMENAVLSDGAGNVLHPNLSAVKTGSGSLSYLKESDGKTGNPFDYNTKGFRVIVDAVRPKYQDGKNGIQPNILTGVTLNKGDIVDFTVQLSEESIISRSLVEGQSFLYFNNGMKAYYLKGAGKKNLVFRATIGADTAVETPLLKVIALTNDGKGNNSDTNVVSDYAGNLLNQPANYAGKHTDGNETLVNSKIDWANLSIDNTKPIIGYHYELGGADNNTYRQKGKIIIDANDPGIVVPSLDPDPAQRGVERPSKGIYRPTNMTAEASPSVGLVYYWWSKSPADPFAGHEEDHNAALKRYALSAKQPSEDLYTTGFENVKLSVANNKTNLIAPPPEAYLPENSGQWYLHTWTADMTWDSARELMQYEKMTRYIDTHEEQYNAWMAEATGSPADKEVYAKNKALVAVGQYGDTSVWELNDFKHDDSNWTHNVGVLRLDNQGPAVVGGDVYGDNTAGVQISALVKDDLSGVDRVSYQWVKDGETPSDINWVTAELKNGVVTETTLNEVYEYGKFWLYLKSADKAGNESVQRVEAPANVGSQSALPGQFETEADPKFVRSHDVDFKLTGFDPDYVGYVISASSIHPEETAFTALQSEPVPSPSATPTMTADPNASAAPAPSGSADPNASAAPAPSGSADPNASATPAPSGSADPNASAAPAPSGSADPNASATPAPSGSADPNASATPAPSEAPEKSYSYTIPADSAHSGVQYVHVLVKKDGESYFYAKAYYWDNEPSQITFSKNGVPYPLDVQDVTVSISERYSREPMTSKYQWVRVSDPATEVAPDAASAGWTALPAGGAVSIKGKDVLKPGETDSFRLYVWNTDGAGNSSIERTPELFKVTYTGDETTPPADTESKLIYLYGDEQDGYTAILKLNLDTESKAGYEYSVSPDNGESWTRWRSYTNFVSLEVPSNDPAQLQVMVKYRTPGGAMSEPFPIDSSNASFDEAPVYALASVNSNVMVRPDKGADIQIEVPAGLKVIPAAVNPSKPVRSGNTFNVKENGFYAFDIVDLNDSARTDTLYMVVKNVDGTPPVGWIDYKTTAWTNGNVTVKLNASEPVMVMNNGGSNVYTFTENGSFTFEFKDQAGNTATITAEVHNIRKGAPKVTVVRSYDGYKTVPDGKGGVYASGVSLEVQSADSPASPLFVTVGSNPQTLTKNGTVSFTVQDEFGNTAVVKETVGNLIAEGPSPDKIDYIFVDDNGQAVPDSKIVTIGGKKYAKGKMKVVISGTTAAGNPVFSGMAPAPDSASGTYSNQISDGSGQFVYTRSYESNGTTQAGLSDLLGHSTRVPLTIQGLDNAAPVLTLKQTAVGVVQNKENFKPETDLGGYTVTDNVSARDKIKVTVTGLDIKKLGRQTVTYTAEDQVGNKTVVTQEVLVVKNGGLLIFGNDAFISASSGETALFDTNTITFRISGYNLLKVGGKDLTNEWGTYDLYYQSGLYREGQMKAIATRITYDQMVKGEFKVTFPKAGWYTIIVRTQERDREFATFFIGSTK
ncbi:hypothetical protein F4V43_18335 [Paenibacillus spiritus]|uniref:DUF5011 domain-containing protein n=1 Tax=Paenibacillus spiritus TaxID=2496557 RepID=A0A5J5FV82_9BACL|nr:hypothetical protein [Paenibacillus spiritus]KAA8997248.1 hypothetical protein F4V43_18335 [Paenibacillus spiritus]